MKIGIAMFPTSTPPTRSAKLGRADRRTASSHYRSTARAPRIAGIEDEVFDRFARLQDRHATRPTRARCASGPDPDRRTRRASCGTAARIGRWCGSPQDTGGAISDSDTGTIRSTDVVANTTSLSEAEAIRSRFRGRVRGQNHAERVAGNHRARYRPVRAAAMIMRDRVRQLTDDQLSQAEASQRISSRSPDDGRLKRCHCSHATTDPLG